MDVAFTLLPDLAIGLRPPAFDDAFELAAVVGRVDRIFLPRERGEDRRHVLRDRAVDGEQVGEIEAPIGVGVPLGEQEFRHPPALAGVLVGDGQQFFESKSDAVFHGIPSGLVGNRPSAG